MTPKSISGNHVPKIKPTVPNPTRRSEKKESEPPQQDKVNLSASRQAPSAPVYSRAMLSKLAPNENGEDKKAGGTESHSTLAFDPEKDFDYHGDHEKMLQEIKRNIGEGVYDSEQVYEALAKIIMGM